MTSERDSFEHHYLPPTLVIFSLSLNYSSCGICLFHCYYTLELVLEVCYSPRAGHTSKLGTTNSYLNNLYVKLRNVCPSMDCVTDTYPKFHLLFGCTLQFNYYYPCTVSKHLN